MATRAKATRAKAAPRSRAQRGAAKGKANEQRKTVEDANARVINGMKELVYAQIGLYGQIYDELDAPTCEAPGRQRDLRNRRLS